MPPPEVRLRDQGRAGERSGRPPVPGVAFVVLLEPSVPAREKSLPGFAKVYKTMIFSKKGLGGSDGSLPVAGGMQYRRWAAWVASVSKPLLMKMRGCYITNVKNQK